MSKIGRPKLPKATRKARVLSVRLTIDERRAVEAAAKRDGTALPEWTRRAILAAAGSAPT